jgi:hypothetical protein
MDGAPNQMMDLVLMKMEFKKNNSWARYWEFIIRCEVIARYKKSAAIDHKGLTCLSNVGSQSDRYKSYKSKIMDWRKTII